ncbi:hypothetical protein ACFOY2_05015 [Nonomuraea purpurea]|uniref:Uncharacterized protein n=1 Tax=Nonomuraea purpurea TaxID=1849276 RepID=A0ABV8G0P8_9ACTN
MADTTEKTVAGELREAAQELRALAAAQWRTVVSPELAEPLASWLEQVANEAERHGAQGMGNSQDEVIYGPCLAVARVLNGTSPQERMPGPGGDALARTSTAPLAARESSQVSQ